MDSQLDQNPRFLEYREMEKLVRRMQDKVKGVTVKCQKSRFNSIPEAVTGQDVTEWLQKNVTDGDAEAAQHLASLLCRHGYMFNATDSKQLNVKEDNTPYRFQADNFWPSRKAPKDNEAYAIYLNQRLLRNKQNHGLDEHEQKDFDKLGKLLSNMESIKQKATEKLKSLKEMDKTKKAVFDSQERAFWRMHRPPPGAFRRYEEGLKHYFLPRQVQERLAKKDFLERKVKILRRKAALRMVKASEALETYQWRAENYKCVDPFLYPAAVYPSNPWISNDENHWCIYNGAEVLAQRVIKWELSFRDLLSDSRGLEEFRAFLEKEYSQENLDFWHKCENIKFDRVDGLLDKIDRIFSDYLAAGSPHEVNIDSKTRQQAQAKVKEARARPSRFSRFTFHEAQEQIFRLMMKDSYVRFLRSEQFQELQNNALKHEPKKGPGFRRPGLSLSPSPRRRMQSSQSDDLREEGMAEAHRAHSTDSLLDDKSAVQLRSVEKRSSSMRKCETSPSLSGRAERAASFTKGSEPHSLSPSMARHQERGSKGGSFNKKQSQQPAQQTDTPSRKSFVR